MRTIEQEISLLGFARSAQIVPVSLMRIWFCLMDRFGINIDILV